MRQFFVDEGDGHLVEVSQAQWEVRIAPLATRALDVLEGFVRDFRSNGRRRFPIDWQPALYREAIDVLLAAGRLRWALPVEIEGGLVEWVEWVKEVGDDVLHCDG